jgi:hypothetical protein
LEPRSQQADFEKNKNYLLTSLKVLMKRADNLNNGGLQPVSAGKASVTAS